VQPRPPSFPNHTDKYSGTPLISPDVIVARLLSDDALVIPECVVLGYSSRLRSLLLGRGFTLISDYSAPWHSMWLQEGPDIAKVGVVEGFGFGAPGAAIVIEELVALGVRRFISLGYAGGLPDTVDFGDVVLCTGAIRDEGVSHHYVAAARYAYPTPALTEEVRNVLAGSGTTFVEGPSWTVDAIYRETVEEARLYRDEGVVTVEMEAAALFTIAAVRGVSIAAIFTISDHLLGSPEWRAAPDRRVLTAGLATVLDAALVTLSPEGDFALRSSPTEGVDSEIPFA
jgi:uridine phosphorylase